MLSVIFSILVIAAQVALIVHVIRTGRPIFWVFILFFFPLIGSIIYFITEVMPDLRGNPRARSAMREIRRSIDPEGDIRTLEKQHKLAGSIDSARHLAGELVAAGRYGDAIAHYRDALTGMYKNDPDLLLGLSEAQFGKKDYDQAQATLERLAAANPDYKSPQGHLLYARALEKSGNTGKALDVYEEVSAYFAGAEARCRYASLLENEGRGADALAIYRDIMLSAEVAPSHYRKAQKEWLDRARTGIQRLDR